MKICFQVGVAVITTAGVGEASDFMVNRTDRARPGSEPRDIRSYKGLNANEIQLYWEEPMKANGPISSYEVKYTYVDYEGEEVEHFKIINKKHVLLKDLAYNAEYDIRIRACSFLAESLDPVCSEFWGALKFTTGVGRKFDLHNL